MKWEICKNWFFFIPKRYFFIPLKTISYPKIFFIPFKVCFIPWKRFSYLYTTISYLVKTFFVTYCAFISCQAQAVRNLNMVFHTKWPSFHTQRNQFHTHHLIFHSSHCPTPLYVYIHLQLKELAMFADASFDQIMLLSLHPPPRDGCDRQQLHPHARHRTHLNRVVKHDHV